MSPVAVPSEMATQAPSAILQRIYSAPDAQALDAASTDLANYVENTSLHSLTTHDIIPDLTRATTSKSGYEREGALAALEVLFRIVGGHGGADPYFLPLLPVVLDRYQESGKGEVVKDAAERAAKALAKLPPPELVGKAIDAIFAILESGSAKWRVKVGALELLRTFSERAKEQVAERLGEIVPRLTQQMRDTKAEVSTLLTSIWVRAN
jgi:elongation factor 3